MLEPGRREAGEVAGDSGGRERRAYGMATGGKQVVRIIRLSQRPLVLIIV